MVVAPAEDAGTGLVLARGANDAQKTRIGNQTGGRVFLFLYTDNFVRDYQRVKAAGVIFLEEPRQDAMAESSSSATSTAIAGT